MSESNVSITALTSCLNKFYFSLAAVRTIVQSNNKNLRLSV